MSQHSIQESHAFARDQIESACKRARDLAREELQIGLKPFPLWPVDDHLRAALSTLECALLLVGDGHGQQAVEAVADAYALLEDLIDRLKSKSN